MQEGVSRQQMLQLLEPGNKVRVMHDITTNEVVVEKGNLAPGQYFIELQGKAKTFRGRMIVE